MLSTIALFWSSLESNGWPGGRIFHFASLGAGPSGLYTFVYGDFVFRGSHIILVVEPCVMFSDCSFLKLMCCCLLMAVRLFVPAVCQLTLP